MRRWQLVPPGAALRLPAAVLWLISIGRSTPQQGSQAKPHHHGRKDKRPDPSPGEASSRASAACGQTPSQRLQDAIHPPAHHRAASDNQAGTSCFPEGVCLAPRNVSLPQPRLHNATSCTQTLKNTAWMHASIWLFQATSMPDKMRHWLCSPLIATEACFLLLQRGWKSGSCASGNKSRSSRRGQAGSSRL